MKSIPSLLIAIMSILLFSCGGGSEEKTETQQKVETKDVKGTIEADGAEIGMMNYSTDDGSFEAAEVNFEKCSFTILPTTKTFQEEWEFSEGFMTGMFGSYEMIEKTESSAFYKVIKKSNDEEITGYNFIVMIKGDSQNFILKGEGENMHTPIIDKADAEKAFKAAQSFKPE